MIRLLRDIAVAGVVLALVAAAILAYAMITTVTVRNHTGQELRAVEVGVTGRIFWRGEMGIGDSKWTFGYATGDASVEIRYAQDERSHEILCGYVGNYFPGSFEIDRLPGGASDCNRSPVSKTRCAAPVFRISSSVVYATETLSGLRYGDLVQIVPKIHSARLQLPVSSATLRALVAEEVSNSSAGFAENKSENC